MTKYLAAILNLVALCVLGAVIVLLLKPQAPNRIAVPHAGAPTPSPAATQAMTRLHELERRVGSLSRLAPSVSKDMLAPLALGVDAPQPVSASAGMTSMTSVTKRAAEPEVSIIYLSSTMRKAVIDGALVGVGERLANGMRVVSIDVNRVVVEARGRTRILRVPESPVLGSVMRKREGQQ